MRYNLTISFATFISGEYLNTFYESIFKQNLKNFEVVVADDGSTDDSVDITLKWAKKYKNIKLIRQLNSGLSIARNRAFWLLQ
jgi:glycosyltransferase involved in cell wall biosynthesis